MSEPIVDTGAGFLSFGNLKAIIRRRRLTIAACFLALFGIGIAYLVTTKPMYGASATIFMDIQNAQMIEGNGAVASVAPLGLDEANVNSQLAIIQSEKIAVSVIEKLDLKDLPEFNRPQSGIAEGLSNGIAAIRSALRSGPQADADDGIPRSVITSFASRLSVERVSDTFVIAIGFMSEDPQRAAAIANAVADAYLNEKLDARYDSVRRASVWLEARLAELGQEAVASERLVQQYKTENGIIDSNGVGGQLLTDTQLNDVSTRLIEARKETAQRQARYDQIQQMIQSGNPDASVVDSLASPVINELRRQYSIASQQESDLARRYGADHQAVQKLRSQMEDINALLLQELGRIAQVYRSDLEIAQKQQADLEQTVDSSTARSGQVAQAEVRLQELERDAKANQNLYESFLERYKSALQQQSFPITDARILTPASPPSAKSSPKAGITLALSGLAGLALGLMLALGRELADNAIRTPAQVERLANLPFLGVLPSLARAAKPPSDPAAEKAAAEARQLTPDLGLLQFTIKEPLSRYSETLRSIKIAADFAGVDHGVRVIGVISSTPGEGKSTLAMNFAQLVANAGHSVLIIDADLRNPTLTRDVAPGAKAGLFEFLVGTTSIAETVYSDTEQPLRFLPASGRASVRHSSELIGSARMADMLAAARETYDYVILDLPPLAPVVDAKAIAGAVDGFVYVIEWGKTTVATVTDALHNAAQIRPKILGCVLNKANMSALRLYSSGEGQSAYYSDDSFAPYITRS